MSSMLTTIDNPYNPFEDYRKWHDFDTFYGYFSAEKVAALAHTSEQFTDLENEEELEKAIDRWLSLDFLGLYVKATPENIDSIIEAAKNKNYMTIEPTN